MTSSDTVILLNYGAGNMASIRNALNFIDINFIELTSGPLPISAHYIYLLPGVGSFAQASLKLKELGFDKLASFAPKLLGICLGMQLMFDDSTEDGFNLGLGLMSGSVKPIASDPRFHSDLLIPHVGWQPLSCHNHQYKDQLGNFQSQDMYFVHSYMVIDLPPENIIASVQYGNITIPSIVACDNFLGFQFHPEKSGPRGLDLLRRSIDFLAKK